MSIEGQNLVKNLLTYDYNKRISGDELKNNRWLQGEFKVSKMNLENKNIIQKLKDLNVLR